MKTKLTLFVAVLAVALFGVGCGSVKITEEQLQEGLVAHYPFNGNAKDESGNGKDGKVKGAILTADRAGKSNSAYKLDGVHGIKLPLTPEDVLKQNTLSGWIKALELNKHRSSGGNINVCLIGTNLGLFTDRNGKPFHRIYAMSDESDSRNDHAPVFKRDVAEDVARWCQISGTYDGTTMKLYINGEFVSMYRSDIKLRALTNVHVGSWEGGGSWNLAHYCLVDDIRIYNRALSAKEVKALYDLEKPKGK